MKVFEQNVIDFLQHKEKKVLVIKGKWGVGKTFIWNQIVEKNTNILNFSNYSYVSLFGLNDLKELQSSVFYSARALSENKKTTIVKSNMKKVGSLIKNIPQASKYSTAISIIENSLVNDYLICIDDLERKSENLSMLSLLGYVSNLSASSDCKIVLIFNDDTLKKKDKKDIDKYREKVIDLELEFSPFSERNIDVEFKHHQCRDLICNIFKSENLNNIRIIKHIKWNIDGLIDFVADAQDAVKTDILSTIAILTYVHHEPSLAIRANEIERVFSYLKDKTESDTNLRNRISALGYIYYADHEREIINYIENGKINDEKFSSDINTLNERQLKDNISTKLTKIWGFYNNNFNGSAENVTDGLKDFLGQHMDLISIRALRPIIETLFEIEDDFDKQYWFDRYVAIHLKDNNSQHLKNLKTITTNSELLEEIEKKESVVNNHYSIYTVLHKIVTNSGWSTEDELYLGSHDSSEVYEFLINDHHEDLMAIVREAINYFPPAEGEGARAVFGRNLNESLLNIAQRSKIDRYRITHFFGLEIPSEQPA